MLLEPEYAIEEGDIDSWTVDIPRFRVSDEEGGFGLRDFEPTPRLDAYVVGGESVWEPTPVGGCCRGLLCTIEPRHYCEDTGGTYQGDDTVCDPNPCVCSGACCVEGICTITTNTECSGTFQGCDTTCDPDPCGGGGPSGACCIAGVCSIQTAVDCAAAFGTYQGDDTECDPVCPCPSPCRCLHPGETCCDVGAPFPIICHGLCCPGAVNNICCGTFEAACCGHICCVTTGGRFCCGTGSCCFEGDVCCPGHFGGSGQCCPEGMICCAEGDSCCFE